MPGPDPAASFVALSGTGGGAPATGALARPGTPDPDLPVGDESRCSGDNAGLRTPCCLLHCLHQPQVRGGRGGTVADRWPACSLAAGAAPVLPLGHR